MKSGTSEGRYRRPRGARRLRLILLTGQRPGEVMGLHSKEISGNWWTLPKERTKARLDKNRADHTVFLVPEALELIGTKTGFIFESRVKSRDGSPPEAKPISVNALGQPENQCDPVCFRRKVDD